MSEKSCPHCGGVLTKGRSLPDHRRLFGLIAAAFSQWPHDHPFQPDNSEHLRAWLTCKAGYREATEVFLPDCATDDMRRLFVLATEAAIKAANGVGFVVPYRESLAVIKPKSIAWDKLGQSEFAKLRDDISDIIRAEIGVDPDALLKAEAA